MDDEITKGAESSKLATAQEAGCEVERGEGKKIEGISASCVHVCMCVRACIFPFTLGCVWQCSIAFRLLSSSPPSSSCDSVSVCVHIYMYVLYVCMYVCTYVCKHLCACVYRVYVCMYVYIYTCSQYVYTCIYTCICMYHMSKNRKPPQNSPAGSFCGGFRCINRALGTAPSWFILRRFPMHKSCTGNRSNKIIVGGGPPETAGCTVGYATERVDLGPMAALGLYHELGGSMAALEASTMGRAG